MVAMRALWATMAAVFLLALLPQPAAAAVCQDYGGFPDVGGTRVCVTESGQLCRFRSETWGVSGGCGARI